MVDLFDALAIMRAKLGEIGLTVPNASVRMFEVPQSRQVVISRAALREPTEYAQRFQQLANDERLAWLNVSAYGLVDGFLVVGVELPTRPSERPVALPKSINFSGPPSSVLAANWDATAAFAITP